MQTSIWMLVGMKSQHGLVKDWNVLIFIWSEGSILQFWITLTFMGVILQEIANYSASTFFVSYSMLPQLKRQQDSFLVLRAVVNWFGSEQVGGKGDCFSPSHLYASSLFEYLIDSNNKCFDLNKLVLFYLRVRFLYLECT